jgi:hypothetical protein
VAHSQLPCLAGEINAPEKELEALSDDAEVHALLQEKGQHCP